MSSSQPTTRSQCRLPTLFPDPNVVFPTYFQILMSSSHPRTAVHACFVLVPLFGLQWLFTLYRQGDTCTMYTLFPLYTLHTLYTVNTLHAVHTAHAVHTVHNVYTLHIVQNTYRYTLPILFKQDHNSQYCAVYTLYILYPLCTYFSVVGTTGSWNMTDFEATGGWPCKKVQVVFVILLFI